MSLQGAVNAVPGRPYEYGGILPILAGIAGFLTKAVPIVSTIFGGVQQVRAAIQPAPVAAPSIEEPMGDDVDTWLASLSDDELIELAMEEGLIDPGLVNREMEDRTRAEQGIPAPVFAPFTAPAVRTSATYTARTVIAAAPELARPLFGRELM